jgi:signal transduction histidine kinase
MRRRVLLTVLLAAVAVGWIAVPMTVLRPHGGTATTYAGTSVAATVAFLVAGLGLAAAGGLAVGDPGTGSLPALCIAASASWFAAAPVGWEDGPAFLRSTGVPAAVLLVPVLLHVVVAAPTGRVHGPLRRAVVAVGYGFAVLTAAGHAVTWDPFLDRYCWSDCTDNAFLLAPEPAVARLTDRTWLGATVVVGVVAVALAARRLTSGSAVARAVAAPVVVPAALAALIQAAYAAVRLGGGTEDPGRDVLLVLYFARAAALVALAAGVLRFLAERRRRRAALVTLAQQLDRPAGDGSLQSTLRRALGDPYLTVAYWLPGDGRFVDGEGRPADPSTQPDRALTSIVRDGARLAVVSHERDLLDDRALRRRIGSAALLAIDNERLGAELLAHLEDLRASQRRIVATADRARRAIERDLHDGAQQRLLAVLYELRMARAAPACGAADPAALDTLLGTVQRCLAELRELAHGIFPAVLEESGLEAALWTLADGTAATVRMDVAIGRRLPPAVEQTAYLVVSETVAATAPAAALTIRARVCDDRLAVDVDGPQAAPSRYLLDRVGAADGTVTHRPGALHTELPCG